MPSRPHNPLSPGHAGQGWQGRRSWTRRGEGLYMAGGLSAKGLWGAQPPGPHTLSPLDLPQGEAGRTGAPGEKGPNGQPVSA